jgi:hypothetical protein
MQQHEIKKKNATAANPDIAKIKKSQKLRNRKNQ